MSTILYSSCYLDGLDKSGSSRLLRTIQWVNYYRQMNQELGFKYMLLLDNGSSQDNIQRFTQSAGGPHVTFRSEENLKSRSPLDYPYCWRAIHFMKTIIEMPDHKIDKIIFVDTDSYILTRRMSAFIKDLNHDWVSFESKMYGWPLSEIHIVSKAHFPRLLQFCEGSVQDFIARNNGKYMERVLPFSMVMTNPYKCDRFGEQRLAQTVDMDFYSQRPTDIALRYNMAGL